MRHVRIDPGEGPGDENLPWTDTTCVRDRMSRPAVTVEADAPLEAALRLMTLPEARDAERDRRVPGREEDAMTPAGPSA